MCALPKAAMPPIVNYLPTAWAIFFCSLSPSKRSQIPFFTVIMSSIYYTDNGPESRRLEPSNQFQSIQQVKLNIEMAFSPTSNDLVGQPRKFRHVHRDKFMWNEY